MLSAQKDTFPLAGMLSVVKFFSTNATDNLLSVVKVFSPFGLNTLLPKFAIRTVQDALSMPIKKGSTSNATLSNKSDGYQLFVSIPRDCSSLRIMRLIQADTEASPSCSSALLIPASNSGSTRSAICLLPFPLMLMVDMWLTPYYLYLVVKCMTSAYQKTMPRSGGTLTGHLTTTVIICNEVAMTNRITPQAGRASISPNLFTWRFLALNRHDKKAKPCRLSIEAETECEARRILAPHFILSLAARLPLKGA